MEEKMTRAEKRAAKKAEDERAVAEMESAMHRMKEPEEAEKADEAGADVAEKADVSAETEGTGERLSENPRPTEAAPKNKTARCPKCGAEMKKGVCPACGTHIYVPMSPEKTRKIRLIVGAVCIVAFIVIMLVQRL